MKNNYFFTEISIVSILIIVLIVCLNPFGILMPPPIVKILVTGLLLIFGLFSVIVWKERKGDEREIYHKMLANHLAFLTGSGLLVVAIAIQELKGELDPYLVYILIAMIIAKVIGHIYSQKKY